MSLTSVNLFGPQRRPNWKIRFFQTNSEHLHTGAVVFGDDQGTADFGGVVVMKASALQREPTKLIGNPSASNYALGSCGHKPLQCFLSLAIVFASLDGSPVEYFAGESSNDAKSRTTKRSHCTGPGTQLPGAGGLGGAGTIKRRFVCGAVGSPGECNLYLYILRVIIPLTAVLGSFHIFVRAIFISLMTVGLLLCVALLFY